MNTHEPLIVSSEAELDYWFRRHLGQFGYVKALSERKGKFQKPYPDYWCITEDMRAERVELETLSYHFVVHQHDPAKVDRVICVEDNHALYGLKLPYNFTVLGGLVVGGYQGAERCIWQARKALYPKINSLASELSILHWRMDAVDDTKCFYCHEPVEKYNQATLAKHRGCVVKSQLWLQGTVGGNWRLIEMV